MADVTVKRLEEFEALYGGGMRRVRAGLGVTAFGMQVMELPPNFEMYPEHDHMHDEQEEVYTVLAGSAILRVGGEEHRLEPGVFARVAPTERRKFITEGEPVRILAIGAVPGKPYSPPEFSEEGAPVPHMDEAKAKLESEDLAARTPSA